MPALVRKILIVAALDGLLLSPLPTPRAKSPPTSPAGGVKIEYKTQTISTHLAAEKRLQKDVTGSHSGIEAHGIAGLLTLSPSNAFLIAITGREQVASIRGKFPVYVVTNVALIPLSSRKDAQAAIEKANAAKRHAAATDGSASDTEGEIEADEEDSNAIVDDDVQEDVAEAGKAAAATAKHQRSNSSIGEDVIGRKGAYGRFAEKWFSKRGWAVDRRRAEGMSTEPPERPTSPTIIPDKVPNDEGQKRPENQPAPSDSPEIVEGKQGGHKEEEKGPVQETVEEAADAMKESVTHSLTPKLLHTTRLLLAGSRSFYFSYDYDITRSWASQVNNSSGFSLFKIVDPTYFWNRHLQQQFIDSGQDGFVLPLMQGFVGQRTLNATATESTTPRHEAEDPVVDTIKPKANDFAADALTGAGDKGDEEFILTLISRRSTRRAGLRYLRRGVDDHGHTANAVETEQILSTPTWDHIFSFLQIRGSIPLYFSQSPYSLKPRPVLLLSEESNAAAIRAHFKSLKERYGDVHVINLVEAEGNEAIVGNKYRDAVAGINKDSTAAGQIGWTWFDFHKECRGMRFENVSRLFTSLTDVLDDFSYTEDAANGHIHRQLGVLRTNCMDCLDRTNVVQSGAARRALETQLTSLGMTLTDASNAWFNMAWADNGDAISKQYASTAALKGDFTRTRKRNLGGALTDFSLTITRYFTNIISDFFTQAAIDFLLGSVTAQVFTDFEAEMASGDPAVSLRRLRQTAIETSSKIVVADESEELLGGWTLLHPTTPSSLRPPLTEHVLLLTNAAVYTCGFDWALEKVSAFSRVPLSDVTRVAWGPYITSTLAASHTDEARNVGFVLSYRSGGADVIRVNTRSMHNTFSKSRSRSRASTATTADTATTATSEADQQQLEAQQPVAPEQETKIWAFKAMPASIDGTEPSERDAVRGVVDEIRGACERYGKGVRVVEEEVVGLAEAKKGTGLVEQWAYSIKRLVWA
ncbi:SacI homology domain-containing protein [Geopyxis carbonaria]|nr:SacI homology domain-containing protein [Geopyxis carbonaria]